MKKRMKALAALLCVTAMVTGCGSGASDSGTSSAKTQTQKEEGSVKTNESQEKNQKLPLVFPVKEILLTLVQDLAIPGRLCIPIW